MIGVTVIGGFDGWRAEARRLLLAGVPPQDVHWTTEVSLLPAANEDADGAGDNPAESPTLAVPRQFVEIARRVACYRSAFNWDVNYRVLWRLTHGEPGLLDVIVDDDVHRLLSMDKAVRRDVHKMHAFVRFRLVSGEDGTDGGGEQYVAWHRRTT